MLSAALDSIYPQDHAGLVGQVREAVFEDNPSLAQQRIAALAKALPAAPHGFQIARQVVLALADDLSRQFMFAVVIPQRFEGLRVVVKVTVGEVLPVNFRDWVLNGEGRALDVILHTEDTAESVHFEFQAPSGLTVSKTRFFDEQQQELEVPTQSITQGHTVHLTGLQAPTAHGGPITAAITLAPTRDGLVRQTAFAGAVVWLALLVCALNTGRIAALVAANRAGTVAAVVLAAPALFLTLQARAPEHAAVARALFAQRALNLLMAVVLYAAAVGLVLVSPTPDAVAGLLWPLVVVQTVLAWFAGYSVWR